MSIVIEFEFVEGLRPPDCACPQSGVSAKCRHHGQPLAEWGYDEDGKWHHTPLKWEGGWVFDGDAEARR